MWRGPTELLLELALFWLTFLHSFHLNCWNVQSKLILSNPCSAQQRRGEKEHYLNWRVRNSILFRVTIWSEDFEQLASWSSLSWASTTDYCLDTAQPHHWWTPRTMLRRECAHSVFTQYSVTFQQCKLLFDFNLMSTVTSLVTLSARIILASLIGHI